MPGAILLSGAAGDDRCWSIQLTAFDMGYTERKLARLKERIVGCAVQAQGQAVQATCKTSVSGSCDPFVFFFK